MRRPLLVLGLLALAAPAAALALWQAPGDGTLSVANARGTITIVARGAVIGRCDVCTLTVVDPVAGDGNGPVVWGADRERIVNETTSIFWGSLNFRLVGGRYKVRVVGSGTDISAAGRGYVVLDGDGLLDRGLFSLSGADCSSSGNDCQPLPDTPTRYPLGTSLPLPAGG